MTDPVGLFHTIDDMADEEVDTAPDFADRISLSGPRCLWSGSSPPTDPHAPTIAILDRIERLLARILRAQDVSPTPRREATKEARRTA